MKSTLKSKVENEKLLTCSDKLKGFKKKIVPGQDK